MTDFLSEIAAQKRAELADRQAKVSLAALEAAARLASPTRDFAAAICGSPPRIIAEVKRVSPAKGVLNVALNAGLMAQTYAAAGAHALSVLTDEHFFHGSDADLQQARGSVDLPVLRKDFTISGYQVLEARSLGADAVLLIAALLDAALLAELHGLTVALGMTPVVEVHEAAEIPVALAVGARVVGINNRNLSTFSVDLATTERLRPLLPDDVTVISESGISTPEDVCRVVAAGASAVLVGEALVTAPDPAARLKALLGATSWSR